MRTSTTAPERIRNHRLIISFDFCNKKFSNPADRSFPSPGAGGGGEDFFRKKINSSLGSIQFRLKKIFLSCGDALRKEGNTDRRERKDSQW